MFKSPALAVLLASIFLTAPSIAQTTSQVNFDNGGAESGITTPGASNFTIFGTDWAGGFVQTQLILPLYASGGFSYHVVPGTPTTVNFHNSIQSVDFFFVHNSFSVPPGTMN